MSQEHSPLSPSTFRVLDKQERVSLYYQLLAKHLASAVTDAELARQNVDDNRVQEIFRTCASVENQEFLERKINTREDSGMIVDEGRIAIDSAMAGFFRILTVHERSLTKRAKGEEKDLHLQQAYQVHNRHNSVHRTTSTHHKTIHGGPIIWQLETDQDLAGLHLLAGSNEEAIVVMKQGIQTASNLAREYKGKDDTIYAGALSALGVLYYRKSKFTQELVDIESGLDYTSESNRIVPNWHRLATISIWAIYGALLYSTAVESSREDVFNKGLAGLGMSLKKDPKATLRSIRQSFGG